MIKKTAWWIGKYKKEEVISSAIRFYEEGEYTMRTICNILDIDLVRFRRYVRDNNIVKRELKKLGDGLFKSSQIFTGKFK